jgi:hypothetical protein
MHCRSSSGWHAPRCVGKCCDAQTRCALVFDWEGCNAINGARAQISELDLNEER